MFSKTCQYALRAMIFIAQKSMEGGKSGIQDIAVAIDSPVHFIAKILQTLGKKKLVRSAKGPNGGFYLDEELLDCSLAKIVNAIDGDRLITGCGIGLKQCSEIKPCPIHEEFKLIRRQIEQMLENARLGSFTEELEQRLVFLKR